MSKATFCYLAGNAQADELANILTASLPWLAASSTPAALIRAVLESPLAVKFCWLPAASAAVQWPIGRAFGPLGELTWRREDGLTHLVLVTDREEEELPVPFGLTPFITLIPVAPSESDLSQVRLWGTKQAEDGSWQETRIPDRLCYPLDGKGDGKFVVLHLRRYITTQQPDDGTVDFVRYVDLAYEK